ncbi:MAG TPA: hypothetical protein VFV99_13125 [Kofleriaceae bacterium]|nr:hypothetical protein [Kofleriaceae bacterium]
MLGTLPTFSRGLKIVRIGVFIMLAQLVLGVVMTVKALGINTPDEARDALKWMEYFFLANVGATAAMFFGVARAIPELKRSGIELGKLIAAAIGFLIATLAMLWCYRVISRFVDIMLNPEAGIDSLSSVLSDLKTMKYVAIVKDFAYSFALFSLIGTIRQSAIANDQLALRDYAGSMSRALLVMLVADLFQQLTYGTAGGGIGILGLVGQLLVAGYWIYCHVRLQRFLANSAYFMNEPHNLPVARIVSVPDESPRRAKTSASGPALRPSQPVMRPSQPSAQRSYPSAPQREVQPTPAAPLAIVAPPPRPEPPRAQSSSEGEAESQPRFLR